MHPELLHPLPSSGRGRATLSLPPLPETLAPSPTRNICSTLPGYSSQESAFCPWKATSDHRHCPTGCQMLQPALQVTAPRCRAGWHLPGAGLQSTCRGTAMATSLHVPCTGMCQGLPGQKDLSSKIWVFEGETSPLENNYKKISFATFHCVLPISSSICPRCNTFLFLLHLSGYCFVTTSVTAAFDRCSCNLLAVESH